MLFVPVNNKASLPALCGVQEVLLSDWGRHPQWAVWGDISAGDSFSFSFLKQHMEKVVLRASEALNHCLHLYDLFCECQKWTELKAVFKIPFVEESQ